MLTKRIIPCLDIRDGRVVKGVNFQDIQDAGDPLECGAFYSANGADELVYYDIAASNEGRALFTAVLEKVAENVFIPLTVGGGVNTLSDFDRLLKCGADKVSVNTGAIRNPGLIGQAAGKYGSQCVVLSVDVKQIDAAYVIMANGGRENTGINAVEWAREGERRGAGELVVNSIDTDGVKRGFDLPLLAALSAVVRIPIVASGGAGEMSHFRDVFALPGVDAGLAASVFHTRQIEIPALKHYLADQGIPMRLGDNVQTRNPDATGR